MKKWWHYSGTNQVKMLDIINENLVLFIAQANFKNMFVSHFLKAIHIFQTLSVRRLLFFLVDVMLS